MGFLKLLLAFTLIPIVELWVLIELSKVINVLPTIGIVILTGIVGAWLTKLEGRYVLYQIQAKFKAGKVPGQELVEGGGIFIAGALLITPGIITDAMGFLLLIPPTRRLIAKYIISRFKGKIKASFTYKESGGRVYEEEYEENIYHEDVNEDVDLKEEVEIEDEADNE